MKLSHRLERIASFVREGSRIADVGTDHGYIPIYLIERGIALSALAMDVREGPLLRAREHICENKMLDKITTRLSDGLDNLQSGEADTVIMAGMGGGLIIRLMDRGRQLWSSVERWVLSPQSDIREVRLYLAENGFAIIREAMVKEDGKYYTVMETQKGSMTFEREIYCRFGTHLIREKNPVLIEFLAKEWENLSSIKEALKKQDTKGAKKRLMEIGEDLLLIEEAQNEMQ